MNENIAINIWHILCFSFVFFSSLPRFFYSSHLFFTRIRLNLQYRPKDQYYTIWVDADVDTLTYLVII